MRIPFQSLHCDITHSDDSEKFLRRVRHGAVFEVADNLFAQPGALPQGL
jgi:hypothetical protein